MAEEIVLVTGNGDARDLAVLLARHGFPVRVDVDEVAVVSPREDTNLLLSDLAVALRTWLDDRAFDSVKVRVGDRDLVFDRRGRYVAQAEDPLVMAHA